MVKRLKRNKRLNEIHDLHVISLSMGKNSLSYHICSDDDSQKTLKNAKKMIQKKYKIVHITN